MIHVLVEMIYGIAAKRAPGACPGVEPLHRFRAKLAGNETLTQTDIDNCRTCLIALRRYAERMHGGELQDVMRTVALKAEMDDYDAIGSAA